MSIALRRPAGLTEGLFVLGTGDAVGDETSTRLHVSFIALHDESPQGDAGIHVAGEVEIADGSGIRATFVGLEFVNDFHRADFGRSRDRPGG